MKSRMALKKLLPVFTLLILIGFFLSACGSTVPMEGDFSTDPSVPNNPAEPTDPGEPADPGDPTDPGLNSLVVGWTAPTTNIDGTPLDDLAGYRVYYGKGSRDYSHVVDVHRDFTETGIDGLDSGTWYLTVTAYDFFGNESDYSNEISLTFF